MDWNLSTFTLSNTQIHRQLYKNLQHVCCGVLCVTKLCCGWGKTPVAVFYGISQVFNEYWVYCCDHNRDFSQWGFPKNVTRQVSHLKKNKTTRESCGQCCSGKLLIISFPVLRFLDIPPHCSSPKIHMNGTLKKNDCTASLPIKEMLLPWLNVQS